MYKFKISNIVNEDEWDTFLKNCSYATFFQSANFLAIQTQNRIPIFVYVIDENGNIMGQLGLVIIRSYTPYSTNKLEKFTKFISKFGNRATWISGPIIFSNEESTRIKIIQTLISALKELSERNDLTVIDGYSPPQDPFVDKKYLNEFEINGYSIENFTTYVLDLSKPLEEIWKNVEKKARNDVIRAKRREVTVKEIKEYDDFVDFRKLVKIWAKTKGMNTSDQKEIIEKDWKLFQKGLQHFFLAFQDNEIISGLRVGTFNGIAYTHQVLSTYSKATSLGGSLLTWHAIEWAKNNGMRIYDLSGVKSTPEDENELEKYNEQWKGLRDYKKKWGGDEFSYYHFIKMRKGKSYKIFRALSRPDFLYREYKRKHVRKPLKSNNSNKILE